MQLDKIVDRQQSVTVQKIRSRLDNQKRKRKEERTICDQVRMEMTLSDNATSNEELRHLQPNTMSSVRN